MHTSSRLLRLPLAALAASLAGGLASGEAQVLRFPDPAAPGRLVVRMGLGDVRVTGADTTEVTLTAGALAARETTPRDDGLRRLDGGDDYAVTQEGDTITVTHGGVFGRGHGDPSAEIALVVPRATRVIIERTGPGDTALASLGGDVEVRAAIGDITLEALAGGALVEAINGDVSATFTRLADDRPVSISAVRGDVDVRVPQDARARVRFRTLRGEVLTDFPEDVLATRMERAGDHGTGSGADETARRDAERAREQARVDAERAREQAREARAAAAEAKRQAREGVSAGNVPIPPVPPMPPMPPIPPMAGGKVVTGTLNGGGPELSITTLMGDITFRKAEP